MKPSREYALSVLLEMAFVVAGFFLLGCLLVILGIAIYLWLEEPGRMAADRATYYTIIAPEPPQISLAKTNVVLLVTDTIIAPQPLQVSLAETNVALIDPPSEAYLSGAATNAAIWGNGKAFKSGGRAAWELVRGAWRLWLLGAGTLTCGLLLRRYGSALKTRSELRINIPEPGAAPNGAPALPSGKSGATKGPPSVS